ncbi:MAG TPA: ankyrin repeat domain-containing protein, partial [Methyloradius sp.]
MKAIKVLLMTAALGLWLGLSLQAYALDGDAQVEYTDALQTGKIKVVQKYLKQGVDVNDKFFAWSALQICANAQKDHPVAEKPRLAITKLLLDKGADINYQHPATKMTALQLAALNHDTALVKYLISRGADVNIKMRGGVAIVRAV